MAILTQSRDCIKLVNLDGELEYVNQNGLDALGFTEPAELIGENWRNLWPEENRVHIDAAIGAARRGQSTRFEASCPNRQGEMRWWDVAASPVSDEDGRITHVLAISRDVTAQTVLKHDYRQRLAAAETGLSFAQDMAREMRHRLKNQLAVIGAIAKLLARHTDDARELASKLEDKLLALARAQDLLTDNRDQPIRARDAVAQVLAASGTGERVHVGPCPDVLLGDDAIQHLALVLGELQTNALKHGALREGGGRIDLSGRFAEGVLTLRWREHCAQPVSPPVRGNGGFQLIRRIGSVGARQPTIAWHDCGIIVDFHLRAAK